MNGRLCDVQPTAQINHFIRPSSLEAPALQCHRVLVLFANKSATRPAGSFYTSCFWQMLTVSLGLSTWSPVSLRPVSEWESNCEKQSCQGWPFIFKSSVFKICLYFYIFNLCFNALYSSGKKFLDTLSILHNLRYYHNTSADTFLCHYVCLLLRKKPKKQVCEPDKAVHVRKGAWAQNIRNALSFRKLFFFTTVHTIDFISMTNLWV